MREEKFKIIQFIRDFLIRVDNELDNFPKKDIEIKNRIRNSSYDLLELSYEANTTQDVEDKKRHLLKMIAKTKVVDFLLNLSYDKQLITEKKYYKLAKRMDDIVKYTAGWLKKLDQNSKMSLINPDTNNKQ